MKNVAYTKEYLDELADIHHPLFTLECGKSEEYMAWFDKGGQ